MTTFEAEIDQTTGRVARVVVSPNEGWAAATLGGTWEVSGGDVTADPTHRNMAGIGDHCDHGIVEFFISDEWSSDKATTPDDDGNYFYSTEGQLTWHNDRGWRNLMPTGNPNVWEPPTNWREYPMGNEHPLWVQPSGAVDAYPAGFVVEHNGTVYQSDVDANVWEPPEQWSEM